MALLVALLIGTLAALAVPFAVQDNPHTFNGLLSGGMLWVPYFDSRVHWSWAVFCLVTVLVLGLLKLARG